MWSEPIAILSAACSFPCNATTPEKYFNVMLACQDIRTPPPNKRWGTQIRDDSGMRGTYLDNVEYFDNAFFGLSETEAKTMDAQQRIAVQVCYEALSNAGYATAVAGEKKNREGMKSAEEAAVYVGVANGERRESERERARDSRNS